MLSIKAILELSGIVKELKNFLSNNYNSPLIMLSLSL